MSISAKLRLRSALLTLLLALLALAPLTPVRAAAPQTADGVPLDARIAAVWETADGAVAAGAAARGWLFGPQALATAVERYQDSPTGLRTMVYYDKGRLDILDPHGDPNSPWFVSGAALVKELLSGQIQFGSDEYVAKPAPAIPVVGDPDHSALTYAGLAPYATIGSQPLVASGAAPTSVTQPGSRVGTHITALLSAAGDDAPDAVTGSTVVVGAYDDVTGHNIAAPFSDWAASQPFPTEWLLGRPLTEPYWVDATVLGTAKRVLVQAFERRILTYTPSNPTAWQVESANVGQHYRQWRGLAQPSDASLTTLASAEPFGEELVAAATAQGVDPYLLVALANVASHGDPQATLPNGGRGLLGVRPDQYDAASVVLADPAANAGAGARILARLAASAPRPLDWRAVLAVYYGGSSPNWNDPNLANFVNGTLGEWGAVLARDDPPAPPPATRALQQVDSGPAAFYAPSYDVSWWVGVLARYAPGATPDPNGYYCVHPGYALGQRLRLVANGVTLDCTIGDTVQSYDLDSWLAHWAIELNYPAFTALGLNGAGANHVDVYALP